MPAIASSTLQRHSSFDQPTLEQWKQLARQRKTSEQLPSAICRLINRRSTKKSSATPKNDYPHDQHPPSLTWSRPGHVLTVADQSEDLFSKDFFGAKREREKKRKKEKVIDWNKTNKSVIGSTNTKKINRNAARKWTEQKRKKNTLTNKCPYEWRLTYTIQNQDRRKHTHAHAHQEIIRQRKRSGIARMKGNRKKKEAARRKSSIGKRLWFNMRRKVITVGQTETKVERGKRGEERHPVLKGSLTS